MMNLQAITQKRYFEVRPGFDAIRYLGVYGFLSWLATKVSKRSQRMFVEIASNIDRHCLSEGQFEKGVIEIIKDVCELTGRTELLVDVGANIGNHSVALAKQFKQVHSVEPHPVLYHVLQANILRNNCGNITAHNFGLANEDTDAELVESTDHHELGRIKGRSQLAPEVFGLNSNAFDQSHTVELKSAAEFIEGFGAALDRAFIKIDVEGMEQEIVAAIAPLMNNRKPVLGFEWFSKSQPDLETIARSVPGYSLYGIIPHDRGPSLALRATKMLFVGRTYTITEIDGDGDREHVYPLALMIPDA